jgi:hypothetical protein
VAVVDVTGRRDLVVGGTLTGFRWVEDLYGRFWVEGVAVVRALRRGGQDGTVKTGDWAGTSSPTQILGG